MLETESIDWQRPFIVAEAAETKGSRQSLRNQLEARLIPRVAEQRLVADP